MTFFGIVDACVEAVGEVAADGGAISLAATRATLAARIFDFALEAHGRLVQRPSEVETAGSVLPAVRAVEEGRLPEAGRMLEPAVQALLDGAAAAVSFGCTETPVALDAIGSALRQRCIDANRVQARRCLKARRQAQRA